MMGKFDEKLKIALREIEKKIWPLQRVCELGIRMEHISLPYSLPLDCLSGTALRNNKIEQAI